jgi:hypothetical protein
VRDRYTRDESEAQRLDRNFNELLQELRVAQTGVQILFAFLLGIAFQQRFETISTYERMLYVVTLLLAAIAAVLLIAPVAVHRVLFRKRVKDEIVDIASRYAATGLAVLALAIVSAVLLVLTIVLNVVAAVAIAAGMFTLLLTLWLVVPLATRARLARHRRHIPTKSHDGLT